MFSNDNNSNIYYLFWWPTQMHLPPLEVPHDVPQEGWINTDARNADPFQIRCLLFTSINHWLSKKNFDRENKTATSSIN